MIGNCPCSARCFCYCPKRPLSKKIFFHMHGGGFVSQSRFECQQIYVVSCNHKKLYLLHFKKKGVLQVKWTTLNDVSLYLASHMKHICFNGLWNVTFQFWALTTLWHLRLHTLEHWKKYCLPMLGWERILTSWEQLEKLSLLVEIQQVFLNPDL